MQDVCVSFWPEGDTPDTSTFPDMIAKVTDICSTDPDDPTHCATPSDIKLDRAKIQVMYKVPSPGKDNPDLQKPVYPKGTFWHLTKCVRQTLSVITLLGGPYLTWIMIAVDQRSPPTRLPRQLVGPTSSP